MNHKWKNNICVNCGLARERREYKKAGLPYSVLGKDGCWYDKIPYTYGIGWYYSDGHKFERPNCKKPNRIVGVQVSDTTEAK